IFEAVLRQQALATRALPQLPNDMVVCNAEEPRRGVVGHTDPAPRLDGGEQRALHGVFDELEMSQPHSARQHRDQAAVLVAEVVLGELVGHPGVWISMTSTPEPGRISPGHREATSIASSRVVAVMIM